MLALQQITKSCTLKSCFLICKKKMRILVTGATGLIGTQPCSHLLSKGHFLHILTTKFLKTDNVKTRVFQWSPQNMQIGRASEGVDAIINLAGAKSISAGQLKIKVQSSIAGYSLQAYYLTL